MDLALIRSFRHKGLERLFESGKPGGVRADHVRRLRVLLAALDTACTIADMDIPGFGLHPLKGRQTGRWAIAVNANWRLTFELRGEHAYAVDYEDYH
jgi:proteic killer suppression protein